MRLPLAAEAFDRRFGTARSLLVNLYTEPSREGPTETRRVDRPGLAPLVTLAPGPIRAIVFHLEDRYVVSGTRVYKNTTQVGVIPGVDLVRWAFYDEQLVMVSDGIAYLVGDSVAAIAIPDDDLVSDVVVSAGRFVYTIAGTGKFRYSDIADAETIGDLNFASAESDPDDIVSALTIADDLILIGQKSVEWHVPTSDIDAPYIRNGGRRYDVGCAAPNTVQRIDNTFNFIGTQQVGTDYRVYRAGGAVPQAISNEGINAALAACADISTATAVTIVTIGGTFYVLNLPGVGSYAWNAQTNLWSEWQSFGQTTFRVQCGTDGVYGDKATSQLWTVDPDRRTDGDDPIIRQVSSFLSIEEGVFRINAVRLHLKTGVGDPDGNPVVEARYSVQGSEQWSTWREASIGAPGNHPLVMWRQWGPVRVPGLAIDFRFSGDADFVPNLVTVDLVKGSGRL